MGSDQSRCRRHNVLLGVFIENHPSVVYTGFSSLLYCADCLSISYSQYLIISNIYQANHPAEQRKS